VQMNKRAELLAENVVKIVISVIVLALIVGAIVAVYFLLIAENELDKIKGQMDKVEEVSRRVDQTGILSSVDFFPIRGWYLRTFSDFRFPVGACVDSRAESCLCVCNDEECRDKFDCRWFDFSLVVDGVVDENVYLDNSVYQFKIYKDNDIVRISENL
jgi:hypothetical protein